MEKAGTNCESSWKNAKGYVWGKIIHKPDIHWARKCWSALRIEKSAMKWLLLTVWETKVEGAGAVVLAGGLLTGGSDLRVGSAPSFFPLDAPVACSDVPRGRWSWRAWLVGTVRCASGVSRWHSNHQPSASEGAFWTVFLCPLFTFSLLPFSYKIDFILSENIQTILFLKLR